MIEQNKKGVEMNTVLLVVHGLVAVALLGALTHQAVAMFRVQKARTGSFIDRYTGANPKTFTGAVVILYVSALALGAFIYPKYRLDVRIPFEEMGLREAVAIFELKEHFIGIGFGALMAYAASWRMDSTEVYARLRSALTLLLACVVWWAFLVGHILNNIRGFE